MTPTTSVSNGLVSFNFSYDITGLSTFTTYHFQGAASNSLGAVFGADGSFTTAPRFVLLTTTPTNVTFTQLAWSADGSRMAADGNGLVYVSTNSGAAWTATGVPVSDMRGNESGWPFSSLACSADGAQILCVNTTLLYRSTNFGAVWSSNTTPVVFSGLAASADALKLAAIGVDGNLYASTNSGAAWSQTGAPNGNWIALASSADGSVVMASQEYEPHITAQYFYVYGTTNGGAQWEQLLATYSDVGTSAAISADGAKMYAGGEEFFESLTGGSGWTTVGGYPPYSAGSVACSASGAEIAITGAFTHIERISPDYGTNWFTANTAAPGNYLGNAYCTADGAKLALAGGGNIYIAQSVSFTPSLSISVATDTVILSWPLPVSNFILQQSADLMTWSTVTNAPQLNITNLQNQVALPLSPSQSFFRLREP